MEKGVYNPENKIKINPDIIWWEDPFAGSASCRVPIFGEAGKKFGDPWCRMAGHISQVGNQTSFIESQIHHCGISLDPVWFSLIRLGWKKRDHLFSFSTLSTSTVVSYKSAKVTFLATLSRSSCRGHRASSCAGVSMDLPLELWVWTTDFWLAPSRNNLIGSKINPIRWKWLKESERKCLNQNRLV